MKVKPHNADNYVGATVQQYGLAYNIGITVETALPQLVAQDDDKILSRFLFFRSKNTSQHGSTPHHFEEAVTNLNRGNPLCFAIAPHKHEALRIFKRQRLQQNSIDNAEDGGVCPDAEREGDHGNRSKQRILTEHSCAVTEVAKQCFHNQILDRLI